MIGTEIMHAERGTTKFAKFAGNNLRNNPLDEAGLKFSSGETI